VFKKSLTGPTLLEMSGKRTCRALFPNSAINRECSRFYGLSVEMHNTGDPELPRDVVVIVEHVLSDRPGNWRVLFS
jgi:hypothetical protein